MEKPAATGQTQARRSPFLVGCYLYAVTMVLISIVCRLRLLSVPLERDEGGFAYIGQQLLRGIPPYESGNSMKLPGIHAAYALIMALFGESASGIHLGLLLINLGSILLLYLLARRLMAVEGVAIAVGVYALLAVSMNVLGVFAHATHFVIFFALAGMVILMVGIDRQNGWLFLCSGVFFGLSCTMKQNGLFFCLFAACYLGFILRHRTRLLKDIIAPLACFTLGLAIPFLLIFTYFIANGLFADFWFWTFSYVWEYASDYGFQVTFNTFRQQLQVVSATTGLFWLLGVAGVVLFCSRKREFALRLFLPGFLITSFFAMWPGSHFYRHYFILFLPALALIIGCTITALPQSKRNYGGGSTAGWLYFTIILFATCGFFFQERGYLFSYSVDRVSRMLYSNNPFNESLIIADYIKKNSLSGTQIAVLGSEPQIYFYADRPSATDHLFMYSLTQNHPYAKSMQDELIAEIEAADPEYVVVAEIYTSWMFEQTSEMMMIDWADQFLMNRYEKVVLAVLSPDKETIYYWGKAAGAIVPPWGSSVSVYRKRK